MASKNSSQETIQNKIKSLKTTYPSLRNKSDEYVFSALCVKANLYKNPALELTDSDFDDIIVDGKYDGGVDILLSDPNSETSDLIIAQSKYYTKITTDDVNNAMTKMALFYKDMMSGHYEAVNAKVQGRFLSLQSELADDSKIHFVLYTSAPQAGIKKKSIEKKFRSLFEDSSNFEVSVYFDTDIEEEIKESESRRPTVESGKIRIDSKGNYLSYGDDAVIVNVSAFSIKSLYAQHNINLLSKNLRYHIAGRDIDKAIDETIRESPETFWLKNNGITIVCDDFFIDGKEVKLKNFSIINGGQTTYMLHKSKHINENSDLFLPCKIIRNTEETEDEKYNFSLEIAKATNTQKPIKPVDLKANSKEQVFFAQNMREVGVFYQTKRGESVPKAYKEAYLNSSLLEIGKLCLAAIFQMPCASRSKPSSMYQPKYYDKIFDENQLQVAKLCKELLYIDYYFRNTYQKKFDKENEDEPDANERISFAHNARTLCIAFVAFASRYYQKNISTSDLQIVWNAATQEQNFDNELYGVFSNLEGVHHFIPPEIFKQKDVYDQILDKLFGAIINAGISTYTMAKMYDTTLNATNFLKKDKNYYMILKNNWATSLKNEIQKTLSEIM